MLDRASRLASDLVLVVGEGRVRLNRYVGAAIVIAGFGAAVGMVLDSVRCGRSSVAVAQEIRLVNPDPLTETMAKELKRRMADVGFERWIIIFRLDTLPGEVIARTWPRTDYRMALIIADSAYFRRYLQTWCETAVHEALHLKFLPLRYAALAFAPDSLSAAQIVQAEEAIVSDLARLPIWGCPR